MLKKEEEMSIEYLIVKIKDNLDIINYLEENKGFFIDPITHAFQHNIKMISSYSKKNKKVEIKKSIENLIKAYGEPIDSNIHSNRTVDSSSFNSNSIINKFCERVLNFQINTIKNKLEEKGFIDYISKDEMLLNRLKPSFIIPPYFYMTKSTYLDWLKPNTSFINYSLEYFSNYNIAAQIVASKEIFTTKHMMTKIIEAYSETKVKNIFLWIDSFDEHEASTYELLGFCDMIKGFNNNGINVYNLYGSFFSTILTSYPEKTGPKLTGVTHGLEYGEYRPVVPVGGGIPSSKYYFMPIHKRLDYHPSSKALEKMNFFNIDNAKAARQYFKKICNCSLCVNEVIVNDIANFKKFESTEIYEFKRKGSTQRRTHANKETKSICAIHYQLNKEQEFEILKNMSFSNVIKMLENNYEEYLKLGALDISSLAHLKRWSDVLKKL